MTENEARYIVRMIQAYQSNCLFMDATDKDAKIIDKMKKIYQATGGWSKGSEAAKIELILYVFNNGVPGGAYFHDDDMLVAYQWQKRTPLIERPK